MLAPELRFVERTKVVFAGRIYTFFGGNDYHRLSSHPDVVRTLSDAAAAHGLSTAGSRLTTGNHRVLVELERALARFLGVEAALIVSSGYLTNLSLLEAIGSEFHRVFLDATSHSSVAEPCRRFPPDSVHRFRHLDPEDLAAQMRSSLRPGERPLVLTDGVFPSNGDLAPVGEYLPIVRKAEGALLVDDAHAIGVVGPTGKGSAEERGLGPGQVLQTGTLSKALGAFGGLIAVSSDVARRIQESSLAFSGATGIPPPIAAAALRSIEILGADPGRISGFRTRTLDWKRRIRALGFAVPDSCVPIASIAFADEVRRKALREALVAQGVYPPFITYPGAPAGGHFRFTFSSEHSETEFRALEDALRSVAG